MAEFALTLLSFLAGGLYYVLYYQDEKQIILNGPAPHAHTFFMEVKEHVFFILVLLSLYLFVITRGLHATINDHKIKLIKMTLMAIFALGFFMIAFGEFIDAGVKSGLSQTGN